MMLNDVTIGKCDVMSHLVQLRRKDTVQTSHCAMGMEYRHCDLGEAI